MEILIAHWADIPWEREVLAPLDAVITHVTDGLNTPVARTALARCDALIVNTYAVTAEMIASMANCRVISRIGAGLDSVDLAAARAGGIAVCNVPDYCDDEVASHAVALMLMLARGIPAQMQAVRAGIWSPIHAAPVQRITALWAGIIGFGRIGRLAVRKALGVGFNVCVAAPERHIPAIRAAGAMPVSMGDLLRRADLVSVHAPLNNATRHLINQTALASMKHGSYLINTSRGGLVDEAALLDALNRGHIRAAALDVLQEEPPSANHALVNHPNVVVTAHAAFYSEQAQAELHTRAAQAVLDVLQGRAPRNAV